MQNPTCPNCHVEIPAATRGDFFNYCTWDCLETARSISEFERMIMEPAPEPVRTITTTGANPFGRRREVI